MLAPAVCVLLAATVFAAPAVAREAQAETLVDRIVAVVDDDPILLSDIEKALALGVVREGEDEDPGLLRRRTLDSLIEQRLRIHEVERYGFEPVPTEEVDAQLRALEARLGGGGALAAVLSESGSDEAQLRQLLEQQLQVMVFVEERLGARVFVSLDDIQAYYQEVLLPRLAENGDPAPPLDQVREQIRVVLREERLNRETDRWTEELRRKADVLDYLDRADRPLPNEYTTP